MAYTYKAAVWCDACGEAIKARLRAEAKAHLENFEDSDIWPQPYDPDYEESDSPQNCDSLTCSGEGYGSFIRNRLTSDGYRALKATLDKHGPTLPPAAQEWAEFYGFTHHAQPWSSAHEWLNEKLSGLDSGTGLLEYASAMAGVLDGDEIQDLFQSDMEADGYFKASGWYSDEMEG